jgi:hypothetical protein
MLAVPVPRGAPMRGRPIIDARAEADREGRRPPIHGVFENRALQNEECSLMVGFMSQAMEPQLRRDRRAFLAVPTGLDPGYVCQHRKLLASTLEVLKANHPN